MASQLALECVCWGWPTRLFSLARIQGLSCLDSLGTFLPGAVHRAASLAQNVGASLLTGLKVCLPSTNTGLFLRPVTCYMAAQLAWGHFCRGGPQGYFIGLEHSIRLHSQWGVVAAKGNPQCCFSGPVYRYMAVWLAQGLSTKGGPQCYFSSPGSRLPAAWLA